MPHALVVDDHPDTLSALADLVEREGFTTSRATSIEEARKSLSGHAHDIVLIDLHLPDGHGMSLLEDLDPMSSPAIVLITGQASLESAVEALRRGVTDYLTKPLDLARLRAILADVAKTRGLKQEIGDHKARLGESNRFGHLVGASSALKQLCDLIARVAPSNATVLLTGESGVGKEMAARTIHDFSRRRHGPFMPVNCGAITPTLMESELFGHERGSFTGAERRHRGYFERASRGTLFLDEITEMPIELQVKLLRVLETGSLTRTGGEESVKVDLRIIAATNRNAEEAVRVGKLREDLYYRLKVFQLGLPPLRDRPDDIAPLVKHFLVQTAAAEGADKTVSPEALARLRQYSWPGNVRELKNVIYSAYILANAEITPACLPPEVIDGALPRGFDGSSLHLRVGMSMAEAERRLILATLNHLGGNKTRTAEVLGISAKTLYNRLNEYKQQAAGAPASTPPEPAPEEEERLADPA